MYTSSQLQTVPQTDFSLRSITAISSTIEAMNIARTVDLRNEREYIRFIRKIEMLTRSSHEYREYIKYLKESQGQGRCVFLGSARYDQRTARIELHHCPFTLWDIVDIVIRRKLSESNTVRTFEIVEEILLLHQNNRVGLVPLSETCHQLVHDGRLFIPLDRVFGDWQSFLDEYSAHVSDSQQRILDTMQELTKRYDDNPDHIPAIVQTIVGHFENS